MLKENSSILIVESPGLLRECMRALVSEISSIDVVCVGDEIEMAMGAVATLLPALILVSTAIWRVGAADLIRRIKRDYPNELVLALVRGKEGSLVPESIRAGADGYILNEIEPRDFGAAIRSALGHKSYTAPDNMASVLGNGLQTLKKRPALSPNELSPREREVIVLVARGLSNKSIAKSLGLSVNTVEKHRSNLRKKLGTHNAAGMTAHAIGRGWLTPNQADAVEDDGPGSLLPVSAGAP
jgi:DNA-binding NarL/FixJ family response regulator